MDHDLQAAAVALTAISSPPLIAGMTDELKVLTLVADQYKAWLVFLAAYHPGVPTPPVSPTPVPAPVPVPAVPTVPVIKL